ncbi:MULTISPECIES: bifunctional diguanylate cyclase/phosphodiesterase [unclassified Variovorax]|uniref:putative bifunctional diguanylate cyclase/phosphodiesterase n=1 Tax=unclassified Variovorax TaxID=663243 RepID=UPI0008B938D6|nr:MULTISPECIES: EAL domain-containing protein [unclassified Variovorax]SEK10378.1 diguanylate cyclase (GGDEF) domain-containing protein [Variovorax sp. OK202]SFD67789.1 response regulator receiver modulated diguanylate cyclase/phosphodiesterase [Variovorax sp. OK212]
MKREADAGWPARAPEPVAAAACVQSHAPDWRVLVVDQDADVHAAARAALQGLTLFGRPLVFLHAYSGEEARALVRGERDLAMVILDVVTESASAGLDLVDFIRHTAGLRNTRIVLRTGRPGHVPALDTLLRYDINDYRTKAELTQDRLLAMVVTAVRSYQQLCAIEANSRGLELIVRSSASLLEETDPRAFAGGVITQLTALLGVTGDGLVCAQGVQGVQGVHGGHGGHGAQQAPQYRVLAAAGRFGHLVDRPLDAVPEPAVLQLLRRALALGCSVYGDHGDHGEHGGLALHIGRKDEQGMAVFIDTAGLHCAVDRQLLDVFCINLGTLLHSRGLMERLHEYAYYDPLVRLPNRTRFVEKVDDCARQGMRDHILALVDIDDFSATNDVMGHRFGDRLLETVARRLAGALPAGVLLARLGADTFGVLGPVRQVSPRQLLECVREPLAVDGVPHKVSLTCGYVLLPEDAQAGVDLVKDATIALKRAKRDHRGQHLQYSGHMGAEARARALLLSNLRTAIDNAQLFLVYQPQLNLHTRALVGLEALLRWRAEDGSLVPPDRFIPVAEHSGLIVALGQWVLSTACRTMRELLDADRAPLRMAVNVSSVQLQDPGFFDTVRGALSHSRLQGHHLELEITESVAALPTQLLESTLAALRAEGISIAIDDFGTGYSSLSYLERLPLDRIKIDGTFVRRLGEAQGARIAEMVAQLGRKLGLHVLAEGIEDAAAWQALLAMECDEGQGYYIAQPMDKDGLFRWLHERAEAEKNARLALGILER